MRRSRLVLLLALVIVAGVLRFTVLSDAEPDRSAAAAAPRPLPVALAPAEPARAQEISGAAVVLAARGFVAAFAAGPRGAAERAAWDARMTDLAVPALTEGLQYAATEALPVGTPVAGEVTVPGENESVVTVDLDSGLRLSVVMVYEGDRWRAAAVTPEGK